MQYKLTVHLNEWRAQTNSNRAGMLVRTRHLVAGSSDRVLNRICVQEPGGEGKVGRVEAAREYLED